MTVLPCASTAATDDGAVEEAADSIRDLACDDLLEAAAAAALLDASPPGMMPVDSTDMAIDLPDSPGRTVPYSRPVAAVLHAAGSRRLDVSGNDLTPHQPAASPAACAAPAAVTESLSSGWLDRLLPGVAWSNDVAAAAPRHADDELQPASARESAGHALLSLAGTASATSCSSELPTAASAGPALAAPAPPAAGQAMVALSAAAALRRNNSELTPYQHTASPAARVQPAAVTESESDSDWLEHQLPAAACRSDLSAVLRCGAPLATALEAADSRSAARRRAAAVLLLSDADHETVVLSDADTELLEPSDDDSVADAAASTLNPETAAALARGSTVLDDIDDAQDAVEVRSLRDVWQRALPGEG